MFNIDSEQKSRILTRLLAALLPMLLFGSVLAALGVYPFGEKSLLIIDMNSEYVDYLAQMNESLRTGQSLARSWNMGAGLNMLGLIAFYTASPFNILVMLFPVEAITEVLFAVTLLKLGLAGFLFSVFTERVFHRRGVFAVIFSVAYAMNAYGIAYASNIMWLDGMAFLPLVIAGVDLLLRKNRWAMFHWSLVYVFFSSYYIGYMVGAFSFFYFLAIWFSQPRNQRELLPKLARFFGAAALSAGCCAFLLLPAFLSLKNGQSVLWDIPWNPSLEKPFLRIASRLLPGVYDTLTDPGYPNIYCTMLAVFLGAQFFLQPVAMRREKVAMGFFLGFLFLSFSCEILDLGWHAFEDPTWFPARYSFVFPFLLLFLAMRSADRADRWRTSGVIGGIALLAVLVIEIGIGRYRYVGMASLIAGIAMPVTYGLIWYAAHRLELTAPRQAGQSPAIPPPQAAGAGPALPARGAVRGPVLSRILPLAALLLVCGEVWANTWAMEVRLDSQFQYKTRESYAAYREKYRPAVEQAAAIDPGIYRMEIVEQRNANGGMALGYNGISHYSTTTDQALNQFLRSLGYNKGTVNELRFAVNTPVTNGLLGIKYVLSTEDMGAGYQLVGTSGDVGLYRNICALPLAFWTPESALEWQSDAKDPFLLQNSLFSSLTTGLPTEIFTPIHAEQSLYNLDLEQRDGYLELIPRVQSENATLQYWIDNPEGAGVYAYFPVWNNKFATAEAFVNDKPIGKDLRYRENAVLPLGREEAINLVLELSANITRIENQFFYSLDLDAALRIAEELRGRAMDIYTFTDTKVEGRIGADKDGYLATTFPYDEGWRIYLDGVRIQPVRFAGVFLSIPLEAGEHTISMQYLSPGFVPGCTVSVMCLTGFLLLWLRRRYLHRHTV